MKLQQLDYNGQPFEVDIDEMVFDLETLIERFLQHYDSWEQYNEDCENMHEFVSVENMGDFWSNYNDLKAWCEVEISAKLFYNNTIVVRVLNIDKIHYDYGDDAILCNEKIQNAVRAQMVKKWRFR